MDVIYETLSRGVEQLLGRISGPLHFRLFIMPPVVTTLAVRAGLKEVREEQPPFLWAILTILTEPAGRIVKEQLDQVIKMLKENGEYLIALSK